VRQKRLVAREKTKPQNARLWSWHTGMKLCCCPVLGACALVRVCGGLGCRRATHASPRMPVPLRWGQGSTRQDQFAW
jgi:hypothetical protein